MARRPTLAPVRRSLAAVLRRATTSLERPEREGREGEGREGEGREREEPAGATSADRASPENELDAATGAAGAAEAEQEVSAPAADDETGRASADAHVRRRAPRVPMALGAVAVALGGLAVWFGLQAHDLHTGPAVRNTALTDSATTSEVVGQVTSAVNTIFSYDHAQPGKTRQAARTLLTDKAMKQYEKLFKDVRQQGPGQQLVIDTTATKVGLKTLHGGRAHLLIFANQRVTATERNRTTYAGAMLAVDAVREDGQWKISGLETFKQGG